ncbi:hypothetical protein OHS71_13925 [Streptomyces sp. NBC_00377]|uniref:hypothetical protein n=1 Tax=unclassified Streptomyces TaxID=2593676 RepID=UPI002E233FD8|nr:MULTISPECIES: hypothetical protein [unclassified Streptomyces]
MDTFTARLEGAWDWWSAAKLSGIYAIGEQGEIWMTQLREGRTPPENDIARAEGFLTGPGSIEDLELFFYD